jgi:hypothetical protein
MAKLEASASFRNYNWQQEFRNVKSVHELNALREVIFIFKQLFVLKILTFQRACQLLLQDLWLHLRYFSLSARWSHVESSFLLEIWAKCQVFKSKSRVIVN